MKNYIKFIVLGLSVMAFDVAKAPRPRPGEDGYTAHQGGGGQDYQFFPYQMYLLSLTESAYGQALSHYTGHFDHIKNFVNKYCSQHNLNLSNSLLESGRIERFFQRKFHSTKYQFDTAYVHVPQIPSTCDFPILQHTDIMDLELDALRAYFTSKIVSFMDSTSEEDWERLLGIDGPPLTSYGVRERIRQRNLFYALKASPGSFKDFKAFLFELDKNRLSREMAYSRGAILREEGAMRQMYEKMYRHEGEHLTLCDETSKTLKSCYAEWQEELNNLEDHVRDLNEKRILRERKNNLLLFTAITIFGALGCAATHNVYKKCKKKYANKLSKSKKVWFGLAGGYFALCGLCGAASLAKHIFL